MTDIAELLTNAGVQVRDLEWLKSNAGERWTAQYPFGQFEIGLLLYETADGLQYVWRRGICSEYFATLEGAQAAAQADFTARILSALSSGDAS